MGTQFEFASGMTEFRSSGQGVVDNTSPAFAGLTSVTPNDDGSFSLAHGSPSGSKPPFEIIYYAALGNLSYAALVIPANRVEAIDIGATQKVFTLRNGTYFVKGQQYSFAAKAKDAFTFFDNNVVVIQSTAIASGNLFAGYQTLLTDLQNTAIGLAASAKGLGGGFAMTIEQSELVMSIETEEIAP